MSNPLPDLRMNPLRTRVVASVHEAWRDQRCEPMTFIGDDGAWRSRHNPGTHVAPVPLQSGALALDVTEHGLVVYPVGLPGRYVLAVGFRVVLGGATYVALPDALRGVPIDVDVVPAAVAVHYRLDGAVITVRTTVDDGVATIRAEVSGDRPEAIHPFVLWQPGDPPKEAEDGVVVRPADAGVQNVTATSSNSRLPDPLLPAALDRPWLRIASLGATETDDDVPAVRPALMADRRVEGTLTGAALPGWTGVASGAVTIAVDGRPATGDAPVARDRLGLHLSDPEIDRQIPFSVYNSLMSGCRLGPDTYLSMHGRTDRGFGDVAHLHQSHQIHVVALLDGQTSRVRDELLTFARLQDADGAIRRSPRPGPGNHPYVPGYTDAHLIRGVYRYVAWTGDDSALDIPVETKDDVRPLLERLERAAQYLVDTSVDGLMVPCGWMDAWNPEVVTQAQISMYAAQAFDELAELVELRRGEHLSAAWRARATTTRKQTIDVFHNPATGLFAEHRFPDRVEGWLPTDFWAHAQIAGVLCGLTTDPRGLDRIAERCISRGLTQTPVTTFASPYVAASTDGDVSLELDSTAMWVLACWPELTHTFALASTRLGLADRALGAVRAQLPERIHRSSGFVAPWYYAEKYLYPGNEPWLFTWGGDPTLIEAIAFGFFGIDAGLRSLSVSPCLPVEWRADPQRIDFVWRGVAHSLETVPDWSPDQTEVDGAPHSGPILPARDGVQERRIRVGVGQPNLPSPVHHPR